MRSAVWFAALRALAGCFLGGLLFATAFPAIGATIHVPLTASTIQAGINLAQPGDTVLLAPGTYTGVGNKDLDFFGKDIALIGAGGSAATIIDCQGAGRGLHLTSGETRAALVQGITIRNGNLPSGHGGGIQCYSAPTFRDLVVRQCYAKYTGGIDINTGGTPLLESCVIESNVDDTGAGGGLSICNDSDAVLVNVMVRNNYSDGRGGGVNICYAKPQFFNVTFEGNEAASNGGGAFYNAASDVYFKDCLFIRNRARDGGGLDTGGRPGLIENCSFIENTALELGGAICIESDQGAIFRNCLILRNTAGAGGGAYVGEYMAYPPCQFINTSFIGNECLWAAGSAITANWQGKADLIDCVLEGNIGGPGLWTDFGASINASCSDLWGNPSGNYGGDLVDQTGVNGNISLDPLFCDAATDDFSLEGSSPCLPWNNECGVQMGVYGAGCDLTAVEPVVPQHALLGANYPNPFNPSTTIPFALREPMAITLAVFDVGGRLIRVLAEERDFPVGQSELVWDGHDGAGQPAPSGVYFYRLESLDGATARPMLLVK